MRRKSLSRLVITLLNACLNATIELISPAARVLLGDLNSDGAM